MNPTHRPHEGDAAEFQTPEQAEAAAERCEAVEQEAFAQFDAVRNSLHAGGRVDDVAHLPELRRWLEARNETDLAWGRWALAYEAASRKLAA